MNPSSHSSSKRITRVRQPSTRSLYFMRNSTVESPAPRDWVYFWKRYINLPEDIRANVIVQMASFAPYNASLHPSFIVWVNHTDACAAAQTEMLREYCTKFGRRFTCNCPRVKHKSPIPIVGPTRKDPSCPSQTHD